MKRTKYIPAIVTLIGCLAAAIITIINKYDSLHSMIIILSVLIVFYIAGLIIKGLTDKYLVIEEEIINEEENEEGTGSVDSAEGSDESVDAESEKKEKAE